MNEPRVVHNEQAGRFETDVQGGLAMLDYVRTGAEIALVHTEVPQAARAGGVASALARAALDFARANRLEVKPACAFVAAYLRRHRADLDLVPERYRNDLN
jgi:uncharacterized protein